MEELVENRNRWRRLHTIAGALVLGTFLGEHLLTSASALAGAAAYDSVVGAIERSKVLPLLEALVLVPLAFHIGYGIHLLRRRDTPNAEIERYGVRRLWVLQRISAGFVLVFIAAHLWELRIQRLFFGLSPDALHTVLSARLSWTWAGIPWIALLYLVGLAATTFHFSNGLFAASATWNIGPAPTERKRLRMATVALGAVLFFIGAASVIAVATGTRLLPEHDADNPCGSAVHQAFAPATPSH